MQQVYIPYKDISYLSDSDKAYAAASEVLRPFYKYDVHIDSFAQVIEDKKQDKTDRATLVKVLEAQYQSIDAAPTVLENIQKLASENTFTVITAHQPSLFTGPLYFIYKNITAINLAKQLKAKYPEYEFVPVFWMGSEDHDFEEINHLNIFNKKVEWQNEESGATGMMSTDTIAPTLAELKEILGDSEYAAQIYKVIERCFSAGKTYAQATFELVNALFEKEGLVVLLSNNADLKRSFLPYMKKELIEQPSKELVEAEQAKKEAAGLKGQAFAREINLFYMEKGSRERIVWEEETYKVLNRDLTFSKEEMLQELEEYPERFSPNVVLRPIFQEVVLPNLCYIGGGGELAYWMERLPQFEYFGVNFPMLMRRNSVMWIDKGSNKKMNKLGLSVTDIFEDADALIKAYVKENTDEVLSLAKEKATVERTFEGVIEKAVRINNNLERSVKGEMTKILNALDKLEAKLISAEKKNYDVAVNQIKGLKDRLFPKNGLGLQERHDNFLQFYLKHGDNFINTLLEYQDPLNKDFLVLIEE